MMPPLDVHWAWHVHMLAPRAYINDLKTTGILNYKPESVVSLKAKRDATATIWAEEYGSGTYDQNILFVVDFIRDRI